jgi:hypothetical protein
MKKIIILGLLCTAIAVTSYADNLGVKISYNVHIVSVGINDYPGISLRNSVRDSRALVEKVMNDCIAITERIPYIERVDSVYKYILNDKDATLENIVLTINKVIRTAKPNDIFIFYFAGFSISLNENENGLIPYLIGENIAIHNINRESLISTTELAKLFEQISCKRQLIISEAGEGTKFATTLMAAMFESNPLISSTAIRNRIILTTRGQGMDGFVCNNEKIEHGPLTYFMLNNGNILRIFDDPSTYEYNLIKQEMECSPVGVAWGGNRLYSHLLVEQDYTNLYAKMQSSSRGGIMHPDEAIPNKSQGQRTFALVVGTNSYDPMSGWSELKNPINDARAVSDVLKSKYNVETIEIYDKSMDSVLLKLIEIKKIMSENDKFILFIAGHGHYSSTLSDGFIVFKESRSMKEDIFFKSYLQMGSLYRILDGMPSKNVFAIFDVCFGASFDLNANDIALSSYKELKMDIGLDELISRKNENISRIFLASGEYEVPDYWNNSLNHSPFADKLLGILSSETEFISPGKLFERLQANITEPTLKQFGKHELMGDFLLKVYKPR